MELDLKAYKVNISRTTARTPLDCRVWLPGTGLEHLSCLCALLMQALSLSTDWTWLAELCLQRLAPTILATAILLLSASRLPPSKFIVERFAFCCYAYCTLNMHPSISLLKASLFLQAYRD